jgi:hypothetical protein
MAGTKEEKREKEKRKEKEEKKGRKKGGYDERSIINIISSSCILHAHNKSILFPSCYVVYCK